MDTLQPHETAENREVRGFTYKQLIWLIGSVMVIEFTVVGGGMRILNSIEQNKATTDVQQAQLTKLQIDMDLMKIEVARLKARDEKTSDEMRYQYPAHE